MYGIMLYSKEKKEEKIEGGHGFGKEDQRYADTQDNGFIIKEICEYLSFFRT